LAQVGLHFFCWPPLLNSIAAAMVDAQAKSVLAALKASFEAAKSDSDLAQCEQQLSQLKLIVFSNLNALRDPAGQAEERQLAQETLELACMLSIRLRHEQSFERHVAQLKMYHSDKAQGQKYQILGLYLLHLLASDRIGDFHTELELIPVEDHANEFIKRPIELERYLMEGNYTKVLEAQDSKPYHAYFMERLEEMVRSKVGASLERSYERIPASVAIKMLILKDVAALQKYVVTENERKGREEAELEKKAREDADEPMGDMTPSLTRRAPVRLARWEVKGDTLYFVKTQEQRLTLPAMELMVNTIGYATDLERIV